MNLEKFDNKLVKISHIDGKIYEGISFYNNSEYNECEFGREEDSLQILSIIFYKSEIKNVEIIDDFTDSYGSLEELILEDGVFFIEDIFEEADDRHIYRLLLCIKDNINKLDKNELLKLLQKLEKDTKDKKIIEEVKMVIECLK